MTLFKMGWRTVLFDRARRRNRRSPSAQPYSPHFTSLATPLLLAVNTLLFMQPSVPVRAEDLIGLSTSWRSIQQSESECLQRAEAAMRRSAFLEKIEFIGQSVFASNGEYQASIRCIPTKEMAFFVVAGPSSGRANELRDLIVRNF